MSSSWMRLWFFICVLVAFTLVIAGPAPALAAECTLADHIRSANTNTSVGGCPRGTSHDVITITEDIVLSEQLPPIRGTITIEGNGHSISGDGKIPIFVVDGARLTINNLTVTGSHDERTEASNWEADNALRIRGGAEVTVNDSLFIDNYFDGHGGAISVGRSKLTVNNSRFVNNRARGNGGAISIFRSTVVIRNSSFIGNSTRQIQAGGAISVDQGAAVEIVNSTFFDNYAGRGGAVASEITRPYNVVPTRATLTHVTMVNNRADEGSNIGVDANDMNFKLRNSLLISSGGTSRKPVSSCHGPLRENLGNFIADGSCGSRVGGDPRLAEMTGSPEYFALLDGSPVLDAADPRFCLDNDQLGTPRPQGAGCDIGAIESTTARPAAPPVVPPPPCPLADQITAANTDAPAGGCPAGSGRDLIRLTADFALDAPLPTITSEIDIEGNGHTLSGVGKFRILEVDGGSLTISNAVLTGGEASRGGALLLRNGGRATVSDVQFFLNSAFFGGAIATESGGDQLQVSGSSFIANSAETSGGAILIDGGSVAVDGSAFHGNTAAATGGAIASLHGRAAIASSTISGSAAVKGGGIHIQGGEATLTHLIVMNNSAERIIGAGIYAEGGAVSLRNSIVAGSGSGDDCSGRFAQIRGNFSEDGRCAAQIGGDPMLANLVESPVAHYPLLDASPAHGNGDRAFCTEVDQLGNPREHCDIGAIESPRDPDYVEAPLAELPADCTLADQIIASNTDAPAGACPAGDGADTIRLGWNITLSEPLPTITSDITLDGYGHTISGDNRMRVLDIESGTVVVKHIALVNGRNTGEQPDGYGGAVTLRKSAKVTFVDTTFRNSKARMGGALASINGSHMYVYESAFYDNEASSRGGALWRDGRCGYFTDIDFRRNRAGELPGGNMDDYLTHIDGGASTCTSEAEVYRLSDS